MAGKNDNLILISGNDAAQISEEATRRFTELVGENADAFSYDKFNETDTGPTPDLVYQVINSLQSPSFLGGTKTVWLRHFTGFDQEGSKNHPLAKPLQALADLVKAGLPPDMRFIADGPGVDRRRGLFKAFSANGSVTILNKPDMSSRDWEATMRECIQKLAAIKHLNLAPNAVDYLVDALGTDTARIDPELEKLICFRGGTEGTATLEELQQICFGKGEEMTWALSDMLGQRNLNEAVRVIDVLITQNKNDEQYARSMLYSAARFFQQAIRIKVFMAENKIRTPVALKSFITSMSSEQKESYLERGMDFVGFHPFRVQMLASQTERYSPHETIVALRTLRDVFWQTMSSTISPRVALENALFSIIGIKR